jgi:hypothetical protein
MARNEILALLGACMSWGTITTIVGIGPSMADAFTFAIRLHFIEFSHEIFMPSGYITAGYGLLPATFGLQLPPCIFLFSFVALDLKMVSF